MTRLLPLLLVPLVVAVALLPAADPPKAKAPGKGTNYAFLVGCAGYDKTELQPIKDDVTVNDVIEFKKALLATGFSEDHIVMMHDQRTDARGRYLPEHTKIVKELDLFLDGLTKDDTVVVVLSGHGVHFKGDKAGFFCPIDAKISTKKNLLPMDGTGGLYPLLEKCKAGRKLLVANACRNDPASSTSLAGGKIELVDDYPETVPKGIAAIFSCDVGQKSYFDPDRKRSLFMLHMTEAWKGGGSLEDVFKSTDVNTKADARKTFGEKQFPKVRRSYEGEWVIATGAGERKGGEEMEFEIADGVKMTFCWIPPGKATLGSPATEKDRSEDEKEHEYTSKGYWLGKYAVTQTEWTAVMKTTPFAFHKDGKDADYVKRVSGLDTSRFPAENVSWDDAQEFLKVVNKRGGVAKVFGGAGSFKLPHEDEWEYACRGGKGNKQAYYWGDTLNGDKANCDGDYPYGTTTKGTYLARPSVVGSYAKAAPHPWGLCDMSGNVYQWCDNKYSDEYHVLRGGSWGYNARYCRAAFRNWDEPACRYYGFGFRVVFCLD